MITIPSASTLQIGDKETQFLVTGTATITAISPRPIDTIISLKMQDTGAKFVSSYPGLFMDDGVDYWCDQTDRINFIRVSDGWEELSRNEASYVVDARFAYKTDTFSMNSSTWADVTGLSKSYHVRSTSSLIEVTANIACATASDAILHARIVRVDSLNNVVPIMVGDGASNRTQGNGGLYTSFGDTEIGSLTIVAYDKPNSDDTFTYKLQVRSNANGNWIYVNRTAGDTDSGAYLRGSSSLRVLEYRGFVGS